MFKLQTVDPKTAAGPVAELYAAFPPGMGVPAPLQLLSASPEILKRQMSMIGYFMQHPRLDPRLLALIRYSMAARYGYAYCTGFNGNMLKSTGLSDVELEALTDDPDTAPLDDKGKALLKFVLKVYGQPEQVREADIAALREIGWLDSDIMDALWMGGGMIAASFLFTALVEGQSC